MEDGIIYENCYSQFFEELKTYLINNNLHKSTDFIAISNHKIQEFEKKNKIILPIAYKEYLKVFGNIAFLLNFYHSSYSFENLVDVYEELEESKEYFSIHTATEIEKTQIKNDIKDLILIDIYEGFFCTYLSKDENPIVYEIIYNMDKTVLKNKGKFTTFIKQHISNKIGDLYASNSYNGIDEIWETTIEFNRNESYKSENIQYENFMKMIEEEEISNKKIFSINEQEVKWIEYRIGIRNKKSNN